MQKNIVFLHFLPCKLRKGVQKSYNFAALPCGKAERLFTAKLYKSDRLLDGVAHGIILDGANHSGAEVGWGLAHTMEYGKYLELAHGRKHAALEPMVRKLTMPFMDKLQKIYAG